MSAVDDVQNYQSVFNSKVVLVVCLAVCFNALHDISQSQLTSDVLAYIIRLRLCV